MSDDVTDPSKARYRKYLEAELDAAAMYKSMAEMEKDPNRSKIFQRLACAEMHHASRWAERLGIDASSLEPAGPDFRLRFYGLAARLFGTARVVPWLLRGEAKDINTYASDPEARDLAVEERRHARVLREMTSDRDMLAGLRKESGQSFADGGKFRAAVLGLNDGLVSNFSLVMGVAGGTSRPEFILLAGIAGLFAGSFSMAAGEYVSMRSQRDVYEHRIRAEEIELQEWPEEEEEELILIYQAKGFSLEDSQRIAKQIMTRPDVALQTMAREELGLDPSQLGSLWGAAFSSFAAFVAGAVVPIIPYLLGAGNMTFRLSAAMSAAALLIVGGVLAATSGRSAAWGALRMLLAGGSAAAVTYGVGRLVGITLVG